MLFNFVILSIPQEELKLREFLYNFYSVKY